MIVSWFSAGVSSAVATKIMINEIDKIIYTHIDDQHPDSMRFVRDCEQWFSKEIEITQSRYKTAEAAWRASGLHRPNTPQGAPCTRLLKRRVRAEWEMDKTDLTYIWGFDIDEKDRAERIVENMRQQRHLFPLIDKSISKKHAHEILSASGIKRPVMYDLGYNNNNCVGCLKASSKGYWNHIRIDFPDVFERRAKAEREIGGSIIKDKNGNPLYLDELNPNEGRHTPPIIDDCGIFCELMAI